LLGANNLAYYEQLEISDVKSFVILTLDSGVFFFFCSQLYFTFFVIIDAVVKHRTFTPVFQFTPFFKFIAVNLPLKNLLWPGVNLQRCGAGVVQKMA
jgi:hypothetical protein